MAGADSVEIAVTKPPAAWKGIPYVQKLKLDLDHLSAAVTLFEGSARAGVPHFPANVNIAAALAMAGIGFDRTQLKVVADPALIYNTHYINIRGKTGAISIKFESVPLPRQSQDRHARLLQRAGRIQAIQFAGALWHLRAQAARRQAKPPPPPAATPI